MCNVEKVEGLRRRRKKKYIIKNIAVYSGGSEGTGCEQKSKQKKFAGSFKFFVLTTTRIRKRDKGSLYYFSHRVEKLRRSWN